MFETCDPSPMEPEPEVLRLPKCNLHTHLEGSVRPETFLELARGQGLKEKLTLSDVEKAIQVSGNEESLIDYLEKISYTYQVLNTPYALERAAFEAAEDAAQDGVRYLELRAGPVTHSHTSLSVDMVIENILSGLQKAEETRDITCGLIVSALREHDPDANVCLAHSALNFKNQGVVGFDLAGNEADYPAKLHAEAFHSARNGGLPLTIHAGEAGGAENVRYAIEELRAERIGHGINSVESDQVLETIKENDVLLEICPISNIHTHTVASIDEHPVRYLYDQDIKISIGDDDPVTSRTRVSKELSLLKRRLGFNGEELKKMQLMGLNAAFLKDNRQQRQLIRTVEESWSNTTI